MEYFPRSFLCYFFSFLFSIFVQLSFRSISFVVFNRHSKHLRALIVIKWLCVCVCVQGDCTMKCFDFLVRCAIRFGSPTELSMMQNQSVQHKPVYQRYRKTTFLYQQDINYISEHVNYMQRQTHSTDHGSTLLQYSPLL